MIPTACFTLFLTSSVLAITGHRRAAWFTLAAGWGLTLAMVLVARPS